MKKLVLLILISLLSINSNIFSSTSGKITGRITDSSGEPLIGVNVILEGTNFGAATDVDGYYVILNIPPGVYSLKASFIGFTTSRVVDVRVIIDQTTNINVVLKEENIEISEVVVVAKQPIVQKDVSASRANISAEEISVLPTTNINRVIALQAGIKFGDSGPQIRGGSARQTAYILNGITLRDERNNTPYTSIAMTSVKDIQVQTGGFNAEYGNIRSGIVNVITREGSKDNYSFSFVGRYRPPQPKNFGGRPNVEDTYYIRPYVDDAVAWTGTKNGAWDEWTQLQYSEFEGWNSVSEKLLADDDPNNDLTPSAAQQLFLWEHRRTFNIDNPDYDVDASFNGPVPLVSKALGGLRFNLSYRQIREMLMIPLQTPDFKDYSVQLRLTSDITSTLKIMVEGLFGEQAGTNSSRSGLPGFFRSRSSIGSQLRNGRLLFGDARMYAPDYWAPSTVKRSNIGARLTQVLSPSTFYEVVVSRFSSDYSTNPGRRRDNTPIKLFGNNFLVDEAPFGFEPQSVTGIGGMRMGAGMSNSRDSSKIAVYTGKFDITSQFDRYNQFKAGIELVYSDNKTNYARFDEFLPSSNAQSKWHTTPLRGGLYVQDKLEFEGMIANVGLRLDYLDPGGDWFIYDPFSKAFNAQNAPGVDTLLQKASTTKQLTLSPRLGVAFPISVNSKLFFNYGHQRSLPTPENLYLLEQSTFTNALVFVANPNNALEKTIQYEIGYEHNLFDQYLLRLAGFYKDVSLQPVDVEYIGRNNSVRYNTPEPNSYADIRGFEFTLSKNRGDWFQGFINYTYQVTTSGRFGFLNHFENPAEQRQYERETRDQYQFKPVPRPFARGNLNFFTPNNFGPAIGSFHPFQDIRLNLLIEWSSGFYFTWAGGGSQPGLINNVQWNDSWNIDMRLSKGFRFGSFLVELFMDVNNLFNNKYMTQYGFIDGNDYDFYMKSLHLPEEIGREIKSYINIPGDDRPGDYRIRGQYVPIVPTTNINTISNPSDIAIYYESASGRFLENKGSGWREVDAGKLKSVIDNKQYIDMPNQNFLTFLNLRDIYLGLKFSFEIF